MLKLDHDTLLLACFIAIALGILLQTLFLFLALLAMRKAAKSVQEETANLRTAVMPVIFDARDLLVNTQAVLSNAQQFLANAQAVLTRVTPRIESATSDAVEIARRVREQTAEVQASLQEILEKVRNQSERMDRMFSGVLNSLDHAGGFVADAVSMPVRQVSSILRTAKAVIQSLVTPAPRG